MHHKLISYWTPGKKKLKKEPNLRKSQASKKNEPKERTRKFSKQLNFAKPSLTPSPKVNSSNCIGKSIASKLWKLSPKCRYFNPRGKAITSKLWSHSLPKLNVSSVSGSVTGCWLKALPNVKLLRPGKMQSPRGSLKSSEKRRRWRESGRSSGESLPRMVWSPPKGHFFWGRKNLNTKKR